MSDQDTHPNRYSELRSMCKYYIDLYNALYQLKTENEEEIHKIFKMIKTELIDSKKLLPHTIIRDILCIIPYNNRYTKAYLSLAKLIYDNYQINEEIDVPLTVRYIFYKEYGIKLKKSDNFKTIKIEDLDIHTENTIYRAIMYNDLERFIAITEIEGFNENLKLQSKIYALCEGGYSLLELCCYHGAVDCFKLLRTKYEPEITQTCLYLSFLGGNADIMSECLKHQKPNQECMKYAIISHNIDFVTFLISEFNIKINLKYCAIFNNLEALLVYFDQTNDVNTCFLYSARFNILSLLKYFLSHGANINEKNENGETALHIAALNNSKETAELLISHGANINEKDNSKRTPLFDAAENNSKETAELLISHGANINEKDKYGQTALHYAARFNSKETAELLISHGAVINEKDKDGETTLRYAARFNSKEIAELLISHGANINEKDIIGNTVLHIAAKIKNSKEIAELLILHGANINEKDNDGKTALHIAARFNRKETAELLISHGANINEKDNNGETALHYAAVSNSKETAEFFISHGANINEKDNNGNTALHIATKNNRKETAQLLISLGANINEKDIYGETALHKAALNNRKETTELLISHGANINEKDKYGKTALRLAAWNYSKTTANLLISHGAKY
ncbi:ankyrin repeat protein, putative [Trichomonas vaginalis G3]|uniref:Ankyrin repeat protein, putative n=1 Tax=Trichomonas vaginalis (strain ATCC PRA-98 / G3) TaxID=412133 RepID=A2DUE1_TRIV3|nr:ankyrin repeat and SOCS box-containing protein 4 family [Trichomonas vaginalis G3]EAY15979.1 ankyrin repeat protein, putative [Trichomonas vaginalis G3]KAI5523614.1 ankyrin repeat and SOCS box-containing protein 4 family [Trichomonas vaginalis G3]|eukprot:XP_001328202.1 ankyrin repeat protein [Trichomonas vaginalis G3]